MVKQTRVIHDCQQEICYKIFLKVQQVFNQKNYKALFCTCDDEHRIDFFQ